MKSSDRPFPAFVGNDGVMAQTAAYLQTGRFPHALLIEGSAGSGKKTLARLIAKAAVCTGENRPCGVCAACRKAENGAHPDLQEFSGNGGSNSFHIDLIRDIRHTAYILPNEASVRVMMLFDAQAMTPQAQNALLKILEEPPAHLLFILTCENRTQLLPTVRSRTAVLSLSGVDWEQARPLLVRRLPDIPEATLRRAFDAAGGVIGPVLSGAAGERLSPAAELMPRVADALLAPDDWPLIALFAPLDRDKEGIGETLEALTLLFRDAVTLHFGGKTTLSLAPDAAKKLAARCSGARLSALLHETEALKLSQLRNMNRTLLLTRLAAQLRRAAVGSTIV